MISRRHLVAGLVAAPAAAQQRVDLGMVLADGRALANPFEGKRGMIVQRSLPPLLETPLEAFDSVDLGAPVLTPTNRFFVRWHYAFPTEIDPAAHRLAVMGHVGKPRMLDLPALARLPQTEVMAINQCAGNGRALFSPRVPGAQWANGAIGNAVWRGPRLADVLALAGPLGGATAVRASGLDVPMMEGAPAFAKSLSLEHAIGGEVMLATHMNGEPLPIVHGFPIRLIVPGWYSTYWVKMVDRLEILAAPDAGYWMATAYRRPDSQAAGGSRPVTAMRPRSLITSHAPGSRHRWAETVQLRGVAMGGDTGVRAVAVSSDAGASWVPARLGPDFGPHSFRRFEASISPARGDVTLLARATNARDETQPLGEDWNPGGFERQIVEPVRVNFGLDARL